MTQVEEQASAVLDHVRHARRGGGYSFLGWGTFQAERREHEDYAPMAVYIADEGVLAIRPKDEFLDGRFAVDGAAPRNPLLEIIDALSAADPASAEFSSLLAAARALAVKAIVLTDNALLHGKEAFDAAKDHPASALVAEMIASSRDESAAR